MRQWETRLTNTLRQHPGVGCVLLVIAIFVLITISVTKNLATSDGLDGAAFGISIGTLLLAFLGAVLAAYAYAQSVRQPRLRVKVWLDFVELWGLPSGETRVAPEKKRPIEIMGLDETFRMLPVFRIRVCLENQGDATARNVTAIVELFGWQQIWLGSDSMPDRWTVLDRTGDPSYKFQWDGGADLAVHPYPAPRREVAEITIYSAVAAMGATLRAVATAYADGSKPTEHEFTIRVGKRNLKDLDQMIE